MSISPIASLAAVRLAGTLAQEILALPRALLSRGVSSLQKTSSTAAAASTGSSAAFSVTPKSVLSPTATRPAGNAKSSGASLQANLAVFSAQLGKLFSEEGIDTATEIVLKTDGTGRVVVANEHPDKAQIEALLEENGLAAQFRRLSAEMTRAAGSSAYTAAGAGALRLNLAVRGQSVRPFFTTA